MNKTFVSKFNRVTDRIKVCDINLEQYVAMVKNGDTRDVVERGRAVKSDKEKYKVIKSTCPCITGSMTSDMLGRDKSHLEKLNGYIVIDIDDDVSDELIATLQKDKYTAILHSSFGGDGICIFVKINANVESFKNAYLALSEYYFENYKVTTDDSCKDVTRLRFISYDPNVFVNENAEKCSVRKKTIKTAPKIENFVFIKSDFTDLINSITSRHINITESYQDYFNCAAAISAEFGFSGADYFFAVANQSAKYDHQQAERLYRRCCDRGDLGIKIGTLYYYAKQAGLEIYSERTKQIVRTTSIQKQSKRSTGDTGNGTDGTVKSLAAKGIEVSEEEKALVSNIWESKANFLKGVTSGDSPIDKIISYIFENNDYYYDEIKNRIYTGEHRVLSDCDVNDLYIGASSLYNGDFVVQKGDINAVLNSTYIRRYNPVKEFFDIDLESIQMGFIDKYAKLLPHRCDNELEYNTWVLTKWLVGAIHNWVCSPYDMEVCPFVLVITGPQGNGKSSFIRNMLPKELRKDYFIEERIDGNNKDSKIKMGQYLLLVDEEFGGMAVKDVKAFKSLADLRVIEERQAYRANAEQWKRRTILAGTTNEKSILKDVTGNRRILPINTFNGKIEYDEVLKFDTESLLYEAYKLYKTGYEWQIYTKEDIEYLKRYNSDLESNDPFADVFFNYFSIEKIGEFKVPSHMNIGEIINWFGQRTSLRATKYDIEDMMRRINHQTSNTKRNGVNERKYKLYKKIEFNSNTNMPF